jgi:iron complex transport system ATP-binding protein
VSGERPQAGSPPLVSVRDLTFSYAERPVLRHLSLDLHPGDFVGVVGPNGSGKSTLLDLIDGLHPPGEGEVLVGDRRAHAYRRREMAREVAFVPQHFALEFDLSVREVVEMGRYCRRKDSDGEIDAEHTLARLGVAALIERRFSELSGGEKQLVVLAQALMQQSRLLLLDEPASALDVSHQLRLFDLLKQLNAEGLTVLCVLHDLNLAIHYFDKLLVLSEGEAAAFGPPEDVLRPEIVEAVYGVRAFLHRHAGRTYLTFSPRPRRERLGRIHVVCGGGTGSELMRDFVDAGYDVSAGALNALDSDEKTGRELGLPMAVEAPFSPIGDEAHLFNLELMSQADVIVVAAVPVSHGNARNISAALDMAAAGKPVWAARGLLESDLLGITAGLEAAGIRFFTDPEELRSAFTAFASRRGGPG